MEPLGEEAKLATETFTRGFLARAEEVDLVRCDAKNSLWQDAHDC